MKKVEKSDNDSKIVVVEETDNIIKYFHGVCEIKHPSHFKKCDCHKTFYKQLYNKMLKTELEEQDTLELSDSTRRIRMDNFPNKVHNQMYIMLQDDKFCESNPKLFSNYCYIEYEEVMNTYKKFNNKYDLTDPRASTIVKAVLDNLITVVRMQRESDYEGVTLTTQDKLGNRILSLNPVIETKRRYNESVINAIKVLDEIFEGSKNVNLNLDFKNEMIKAYNKRHTDKKK